MLREGVDRDFPGGLVTKTEFPVQVAWIHSRQGTRSHMPRLRVCLLELKILHATCRAEDPTWDLLRPDTAK